MRHSWLIPLGIFSLAAGCATHADRLREVRAEFYEGSVETASLILDKDIHGYPREAEALKLDRAMAELAAGRPQTAEKLLREVRDALDYNSQPSAVEKVGSMLTDDTHTAYCGEDYEKVLVRAMLALANLMNGGADATAYALQVSDMQERIIASGGEGARQNPKLSYKRVALGEYIHGALDEASRIDYNEAARSYMKVCSWEPSFPFGPADVQRATHGHHSRQGDGVLYVFALVGRGPYKVQTIEPAATISMFAASAIINATSAHTIPPSVAPIKVPKVIAYNNSMNTVFVSADGRPIGPTATITDVGRMAIEQYQAIYPRVVIRAVLRRAAKEGIVYGAKEALKTQNNSWANLAMDLGGIAWEAAESADCRCWGLLPDRIEVLRVELPAGDHHIHLQPDSGLGGLVGAAATVRIEPGRNTYLLGTFADGRPIGQLLCSNSPAPAVHWCTGPIPSRRGDLPYPGCSAFSVACDAPPRTVWHSAQETATIKRPPSFFGEFVGKKECSAMFLPLKPSQLGVALVVALGIGLVIGMGIAGYWPNAPLRAVATDRTDGFAVATGYCDDSVEAVYFLDFLTGDLSAAVVSKQNGHFNAFYTHNVVADLGINPARPPRFLLTTGTADLRRTGGKTNTLSRSLIYVAELQSGKVGAYAIPWSSSAWNAGQTMRGQFTLLDVGRFRSIVPAAAEKTNQ